MAKFECSEDTRAKIATFETADKQFKVAWEMFEEAHATELAELERLREDRNAKLDEAKRSLRAELETVSDMRMTAVQGPFKLQKKFSDFYIADKLATMLADHGLYDTAIAQKVIAVKIETASFDEVKSFLNLHGVAQQFECCEDGKDAPSAISGPKPIPPLGAELKKE